MERLKIISSDSLRINYFYDQNTLITKALNFIFLVLYLTSKE